MTGGSIWAVTAAPPTILRGMTVPTLGRIKRSMNKYRRSRRPDVKRARRNATLLIKSTSRQLKNKQQKRGERKEKEGGEKKEGEEQRLSQEVPGVTEHKFDPVLRCCPLSPNCFFDDAFPPGTISIQHLNPVQIDSVAR